MLIFVYEEEQIDLRKRRLKHLLYVCRALAYKNSCMQNFVVLTSSDITPYITYSNDRII